MREWDRRVPSSPDARGQLSLSVVEAATGVALVLAVTAGFALVDAPISERRAQLDAYAEDTLAVLQAEPPRHGGATRLSEVTRSETDFERERTALDRRVDRILPDSLFYRLVTPHGTVGYRRPRGVAVGVATVPTPGGAVRVEVWYG